MPRAISGSFASVYHIQTGTDELAVRCFLHHFADQQRRYAAISEFLLQRRLPCMVGFEYLPAGIRIGDGRFPVLKMDWVSGKSLLDWLKQHGHNREDLRQVCDQFAEMCSVLSQVGIAHGDLQHGNILVTDAGLLTLVDYDCMFVPALAGRKSHELGHRHYQHPQRDKAHFGAYLDNFSAWSIYTSLYCLWQDPALLSKTTAGEESLLFRDDDYCWPDDSPTFKMLEQHENESIRKAAAKLRELLPMPVEQVPPLSAPEQSAQKPILVTAEAAAFDARRGAGVGYEDPGSGRRNGKLSPHRHSRTSRVSSASNVQLAESKVQPDTVPPYAVSSQPRPAYTQVSLGKNNAAARARLALGCAETITFFALVALVTAAIPTLPGIDHRGRRAHTANGAMVVPARPFSAGYLISPEDAYASRLDARISKFLAVAGVPARVAVPLLSNQDFSEAIRYHLLGDYDAAIGCYSKALSAFLITKDPAGRAVCAYLIGRCHLALHKDDLALEWLTTSATKHRAELYVPSINADIGYLEIGKDEPNRAVVYLERSLARDVNFSALTGECVSAMLKATALKLLDNKQLDALTPFQLAALYEKQHGIGDLQRDSHDLFRVADRLAKSTDPELADPVESLAKQLDTPAPTLPNPRIH